MSGSVERLGGLLRKEGLQIMRDPSAVAIAFLMPAVLLVLFGYGVRLTPHRVPLAVVVEQPDAVTESFVAQLRRSPYFTTEIFETIRMADRSFDAGRVGGIVWLLSNFTRRFLTRGSAPIGVIVNGVDANTARLVEGYLRQTWATWLAARSRERGGAGSLPIEMEPRVRFNAAVSSRNYLVPGLMAIVMTLTGALLTALVIAREWERGTFETLMVTQATIWEILLAKLLPYFVLGMGGMGLTFGLAVVLFGVPFRGSLLVLTAASALFMLAALGMGLLISSVARNQFVAGQIAIITTFLPAFILSGFIFNIGSMPWPIRLLTHLVAARYFVAILQTLFLAGDVWSVILPNALALAIMAAFFLTAARARARKRLD